MNDDRDLTVKYASRIYGVEEHRHLASENEKLVKRITELEKDLQAWRDRYGVVSIRQRKLKQELKDSHKRENVLRKLRASEDLPQSHFVKVVEDEKDKRINELEKEVEELGETHHAVCLAKDNEMYHLRKELAEYKLVPICSKCGASDLKFNFYCGDNDIPVKASFMCNACEYPWRENFKDCMHFLDVLNRKNREIVGLRERIKTIKKAWNNPCPKKKSLYTEPDWSVGFDDEQFNILHKALCSEGEEND